MAVHVRYGFTPNHEKHVGRPTSNSRATRTSCSESRSKSTGVQDIVRVGISAAASRARFHSRVAVWSTSKIWRPAANGGCRKATVSRPLHAPRTAGRPVRPRAPVRPRQTGCVARRQPSSSRQMRCQPTAGAQCRTPLILARVGLRLPGPSESWAPRRATGAQRGAVRREMAVRLAVP